MVLTQNVMSLSSNTLKLLNNLSFNLCSHCQKPCYTLSCRTKKQNSQLCLRCVQTITIMGNKNKLCAHCGQTECEFKKIITSSQRTSVDRSYSRLNLPSLLSLEGKSLELIIVTDDIDTDYELLDKYGFKHHQVRSGIWLKTDKLVRLVLYDD